MENPTQNIEARGGNLKPFTGADDPRRVSRGRPTPLNDQDFVDLFGKALAEGLSIAELAEEFNVSERTVKNYKKDTRVKTAALKFVEDRILRITRRTDTKLDNLLKSDAFAELGVDEQITLLLKVRKETLGGVLRLQAESGKADAATINDAMDALEKDPELAASFAEVAERMAAANRK